MKSSLIYPRRRMSKEAALQVLEENKRWPKGTIRKEYIEEAEETIAWYNEYESEQVQKRKNKRLC